MPHIDVKFRHRKGIDTMGMAERIRERRMALQLTQEELGKRVGLQKSAIAKYENGKVENIKRSVIEKMALALDCSPSYLMGFDEYYTNPDTAAIAQKMKESEEMAMLFDAASDADPEDLKAVYNMLLALKRKERHYED